MATAASSSRRDGPGRLGLSRSSLEPRVKSTGREGEAATSYLALRVRWNVAAGFSFLSRLSPVRWRQLASISISTWWPAICAPLAGRSQSPNAGQWGGGRSLASPPRPTASRSRGNECLEPRVCCPTSRVGPCSQLASRRTRDNAGSEAATQGKRKTTDRPLQINPMFPFSSSDRKFLSEYCQPGSTEECCR